MKNHRPRFRFPLAACLLALAGFALAGLPTFWDGSNLYVKPGSSQTNLTAALLGVGDFKADGSVPLTGDLNFGGHNPTNIDTYFFTAGKNIHLDKSTPQQIHWSSTYGVCRKIWDDVTAGGPISNACTFLAALTTIKTNLQVDGTINGFTPGTAATATNVAAGGTIGATTLAGTMTGAGNVMTNVGTGHFTNGIIQRLEFPSISTPTGNPFQGAWIWVEGGTINTSTVEKLLLHLDGTNLSTTITDSELTPKSPAVGGNCHLITATNKFGTAAAWFDGSADYIDVPTSSDFDVAGNNFTFEFWANHRVVNAYQYYMGLRTGDSGSTITYCLYLNNAGKPECDVYSTSHAQITTFAHANALTANTWYHVAFVRNGSSWTIYLNGTGTTATASGTVDYNANSFRLGCPAGGFGGGLTMDGCLDEFRYSAGTAIYTANFTPPSAAFSLATSTNIVIKARSNVGTTTNWLSL